MKNIYFLTAVFFLGIISCSDIHDITVELIEVEHHWTGKWHRRSSIPADKGDLVFRVVESKNKKFKKGDIIREWHNFIHGTHYTLEYCRSKIGTKIKIKENSCGCPLLRYL